MNDAQKRQIYVLLTTVSGPAFAIIAKLAHLTDADANLWLALLSAVTVAIGAAWGITSTTDRANVVTASQVPGTTVQVNPIAAPQAVVDTANDPTIANVVVKGTQT